MELQQRIDALGLRPIGEAVELGYVDQSYVDQMSEQEGVIFKWYKTLNGNSRNLRFYSEVYLNKLSVEDIESHILHN